jgi:dTDP-4-amino-4,6-dideoxygalactose transaminase
MDALLDFASLNGLRVVEDCAQAHGARDRGRRVGAIGDVGVFSFFPGKNLGAYGDGGAITTNDTAIAQRCRMIANHGRIDKYDHQFEGRNSRLDAIQAAVLRVKLRHLDAWTARRQQVAAAYLRGLEGVNGIALPRVRSDGEHVFHLFVVRHARRDDLGRHLNQMGIQTGIHYPMALPKLHAYAYVGQMDEPMIANAQDRLLLSLPMGEHLDELAVDFVVSAVREFCEATS